MKHLYKTLALLVCAGGTCVSAEAQPVKYTATINSAGGTGNIGINNYEWSVGEAVVFTGQSSNILVTQGVLQPAAGLSGIGNTDIITDNVSVYPVPANDVVMLQYDFPGSGNMSYLVTNLEGRTIYSVQSAGNSGKAAINMGTLPSGMYLLQVSFAGDDGSSSSAAYKLEKIN